MSAEERGESVRSKSQVAPDLRGENGTLTSPDSPAANPYIGDPIDVPCPQCGGLVVYNGNYFCATGVHGWGMVDCDWALAPYYELRKSKKRDALEDLANRMLHSLMVYRGEIEG